MPNLRVFFQCRGNRGSRERLFSDIWGLYQKRLLFFVRDMVKDEPEDLFQEIMEKVFRNLERYNPVYSFNTWIYSIARNHCLNYLNRRRLPVQPADVKEASGPAPDCGTSPEEGTLYRELHRTVEGVVDAMDGENRQISYLRFFEGMKHREIARIMGIPNGTVKSRLHGIRAVLKEALEKYDEA